MAPFTFPFQSGLQKNSDLLLSIGSGLIGGRNAQEQGAMAASGAAQVLGERGKRNRTAELLRQQGSTELADAIESGALDGGDAYKLFYQQKLEAAKPKQNFMAVGKNLYNAATGEWVTPPAGLAAADAEYGLTPQYGVDKNGNPVIVQLSKDGTSKQTPLPDGVSLSKEPIKLDAGTEFVLLDPITRQPVGRVPKDLAGAERDKATGKGEGESIATAQGALPSATSAAQQIDLQVQDLKNDPYLPNMLGPINSRTPELTSDAARVRGKINQLKGGAFLQARQLLKGGGAITDFEGQKAEQAYTRMEEAQSVDDFNRALDDFNSAVQTGVQKLQQQATGGAPVASGGKVRRYNPATGRIE